MQFPWQRAVASNSGSQLRVQLDFPDDTPEMDLTDGKRMRKSSTKLRWPMGRLPHFLPLTQRQKPTVRLTSCGGFCKRKVHNHFHHFYNHFHSWTTFNRIKPDESDTFMGPHKAASSNSTAGWTECPWAALSKVNKFPKWRHKVAEYQNCIFNFKKSFPNKLTRVQCQQDKWFAHK